MITWALRLAPFGRMLLTMHDGTGTAADMPSVLAAQHSTVTYKVHTQESRNGFKI